MSASSRRAAGSRFDVGSSSTSSSGSIASTVATATRRRWPKLRWCGARSASSAMPTAARASVHPVLELVAPQPEVGRTEGHVVAHGGHEQLVVGVLEHERHPAADLGVGWPAPPPARRRPPSPVGGSQDAVEVQHEGGLAGAVGPEHGHPLPRLRRRGRRRRGPAGRRGRRTQSPATSMQVGHRRATRATMATQRPRPRARRRRAAHARRGAWWWCSCGHRARRSPGRTMARWTRSPRS